MSSPNHAANQKAWRERQKNPPEPRAPRPLAPWLVEHPELYRGEPVRIFEDSARFMPELR